MLKMVDGTGIIGVDMVCPLGGAVSPPQPPNYDNVEMEGMGSLTLQNSLKAPLERVELLGNSVQGENPTPDNPQEIKSAGRKSKNLFNIADLRVGQVQKDGAINEKQIYYRTVILDVPQDGKYRITFNSNDDYTMLYFTEAYANGAYLQPYLRVHAGSPNYYITLAKGKNILSFSTHTASEKIVFTTDHNIMIAAESETLDYEPYGYFFDLKIIGKNLLSNKPTDWMIGKTTSWGAVPQTPVSYGKNVKNAIAIINVKSSTNYSFINKETNKLWVCRIIELDANGLGLVNHALYANESFNYKKYNFSTRSNTANIVFEIKKVDNTELLSTDIESNKIMLVEGEVNEPTSYEPYTEQTVQIALDEPLRGIRRITDGKNVQEVLNSSGITRRFKEVEITKDTPIAYALGQYGAPETNTVICRYKDTSLKKTGAIICGELKNINNWIEDKESVATTEQGIDFRLSRERLGLGSNTTPEENKVAVIKYLTDHPLHCVAELNEPITEPLPESVQQQLQALHSENGTTHVFVDSGEVETGIKLTYRKEK